MTIDGIGTIFAAALIFLGSLIGANMLLVVSMRPRALTMGSERFGFRPGSVC